MTKKKNNPTGMRYDKTKMDFVMQSENIASPQKALNFLLDKYWWEKKIGSNPITDRNDEKREEPKKEKKETKQKDLSNFWKDYQKKKLGLKS